MKFGEPVRKGEDKFLKMPAKGVSEILEGL
jgi:hypothetical protein